MVNSSNIEIFLFNSIINKKENFELIFEKCSIDYFSGIQEKLFSFLKEKYLNNQSFDISLFCVQYSCEELKENINSLQNNYEIIYLVSIFLEKIKQQYIDKSVKELGKGHLSSDEKLSFLNDTLNTIKEGLVSSDEISDAQVSINKYKKYQEEIKKKQRDNPNGLVGLSTGIRALDNKTRGFKNEYVIVAARPSMGKTALILKMISQSLFSGDVAVMFSLEMQAEQIMGRLISQLNPALTMNETMYCVNSEKDEDIDLVLKFLSEKDFFIEDFILANGSTKAKITPNDLITKAKGISKKLGQEDKKIGLIIIDYIQLLSPDYVRSGMSTNDIMSEISKGLKNLGRAYQCPVIALSQLNRDLEKRVDKRPQMSDLRDSGALEQDADIIMFVYRPSVYLEREIKELLKKKPGDAALLRELQILEQQDVMDAELIIGKQRNGPIGTVNIEFSKKNSMFGDIGSFDSVNIDSNFFNDLYENEE